MDLLLATSETRKPKRIMLPLLVVVFVISCSMLTVLVVLQDRTINSQRGLIHLLFRNSVELGAAGKNAAPARSSEPVAAQPQNGTRVATEEAQAPQKQAVSDEAKGQAGTKPKRFSRKAGKPFPMRPPAEITDPSDLRRVSLSI